MAIQSKPVSPVNPLDELKVKPFALLADMPQAGRSRPSRPLALKATGMTAYRAVNGVAKLTAVADPAVVDAWPPLIVKPSEYFLLNGSPRVDAAMAMFANAAAAVLAPVPPSAMARSVIPVIAPPEIVGLVSVLLVRVCVSVVPTIVPVGAATAVIVPAPLDTGIPDVVPANSPCHPATKVLRISARVLRNALSTLPGDIPVLMLMPSTVVLDPAVEDQSKRDAMAASCIKTKKARRSEPVGNRGKRC